MLQHSRAQARRNTGFAGAVVASLTIIAGGCGGGGSPADSRASGSAGASVDTPSSAAVGTADACRLLTQDEIAAAVGNPVKPGQPEAGPEVCDWDTEQADQTDVLLTVRLKGSTREQVLCADVRKAMAEGRGLPGVGDAGTWAYSASSVFNSGDLEACSAKGYVAISVNGKGDEAALRAAATTLARKVLDRL